MKFIKYSFGYLYLKNMFKKCSTCSFSHPVDLGWSDFHIFHHIVELLIHFFLFFISQSKKKIRKSSKNGFTHSPCNYTTALLIGRAKSKVDAH